jgi:hypothetical protein
MIPAFPLASYFADGLLIISIFYTDAGILSKPVAKAVNAVCFPSIKMATLSLPLIQLYHLD